DDAEVLEALERVLVDTLDGYSLHDIERYGLHEAAKRQLTDLSWFPSPRTWWRLAYDHDGDLVGFIMPARNPMRPVIGYIGVVPEHRGRGYVDDLLAEQTRILAEVMGEDEEIGADTDVDNTPMAAAFARAGYRSVGVRVVMVA
ncbi:MAG TPA: GNAT family N-acetyltransferase, partial [Actinopolymorphaceae bacterium]